ncbi:hypothetical protein ABVK25_003702 [Lepraria finkii]|uniref:Helicase C-terminal domain-containing protein n=1 Tax=Lepraria finkii TaxID=1340010 RepID=A0ABR4BGZ2_9LECA
MNVLLMTTGTGAVGLNLSVADRVYIVERQWNPSVEEQAIARVYRLGQTRPVTIVRLIMEGTIEEPIRNLQTKKLKLEELTLRKETKEEHTLALPLTVLGSS